MIARLSLPMIALSLGLMVLNVVGCSGANGKAMIANANDNNVKRLATMYSFFHLRNEFRGPKDEAEFKKFIAEQDASRLALAGIKPADLEGLFTGERDQQPLKVRYGLNTRVRGPSLPVVFEAEGVNGMRHVGFTNGPMREVDSATYDSLFQGEADNEALPEQRGPEGQGG